MDLMGAVIGLIPMILSLTVHEWAHAWTAYQLGDDTAARAGRLTLNPIPHIDPLGTLILPLFVGIGWAKPVPYNPANFRSSVHMGPGSALVSAAGPISNVLLAVLSASLLGVALKFWPDARGLESPPHFLLYRMVWMNCGLALFNLLPVPPLDGAGLVGGLLPFRFREVWHRIQQLGPFLLAAVFLFGGRLVAGPIDALAGLVFSITRLIR